VLHIHESLAKVITATTNLPLDRLFTKINNIKGALDEDQEAWKSVAMILGWPEWQLKTGKSVDEKSKDNKKSKTKKQKIKQSTGRQVKSRSTKSREIKSRKVKSR